MGGLEFYSYVDDRWCKSDDGRNFVVDESCTEVISYILNNVRARYPDAYTALEEWFKKIAPNVNYYQFLMGRQFCKCNFGTLDATKKDVDSISRDGTFNFEKVSCPLRGGVCPYEGKICMPKFNSTLSKDEERVMKLWYQGLECEEIGESLYKSPRTVKTQINSAYNKLGVHSKAEFVKYANENNMFQETD